MTAVSRTDRPRERASVPSRLVRRLLAAPDPVLDRIIDAPPIRVDGRVLNRRVQAIVVVGTRLGLTDDAPSTVEARRAQLSRITALGMPRRTDVHVVDRRIPGPESELPIRIYRPFGAEAEPPAIVYFHGGGWVTGDLATHDGSCRLIADTTGCVVIAVDYRLAPEHPFPAPVDDAVAAYTWVRSHAAELAVDRGRIGVMGDSAGANLAAVVAQVTRDGDVAPPAAQCLIYPSTDAYFTQPSHQLFADGFFLTRESMEWFRGHYVPDESTWSSPLVSPSKAADLSGLAPALVVTAGFDPLRDEGIAYAEALNNAGVPARSRCFDDMVHGFFGMGVLPEGMAMATEIAVGTAALLRS